MAGVIHTPGADPHAKQKGGRSLCRPHWSWNDLLQVRHRGQVSRELDDAGRAAPSGLEATRVDGGYAGQGCGPRSIVAGEGVALALGQVGVGVAEVEGEDLVGEADADVPGVVARL